MVELSKYAPEDLKAVTELAQRFSSFDTTPTLADIEGMYSRSPEYFFVAKDHGSAIGFVTGYERKGIPDEVLQSWSSKRVGYVDLMAVDPNFRRKGVGMALMNMLLDQFQRNGIDTVHLDVPVEQEAAVGLYRKIGFKVRAYNMRKRLR